MPTETTQKPGKFIMNHTTLKLNDVVDLKTGGDRSVVMLSTSSKLGFHVHYH